MVYNRKRYIIALIVLGVTFLAAIGTQIGIISHKKYCANKNEIIINEVFSTLTYNENAHERELDTIQNLKSLSFLTNSQLAKINNKLSLLYLLNLNFPEYFKTTGEALYYADVAKDYDTETNIYLNIARYFFQINSINQACDTIEIAFKKQKVEEIKNISIKCLAYQMYAEYFLAKKQYESAMKYNKFLSATAKDLTMKNEIDFFNRSANAQKAMILFESGNKSAAYILVNQLEKDPVLITPPDNLLTVYDFAMPIFYIKAFEGRDKWNYIQILDSYKRYSDYCETYFFNFKKTILAMKVIDMLPPAYSAEINKIAYDVAISHENMAIKYINSYTDELFQKLDFACQNLKVREEHKKAASIVAPKILFITLIVVFILMIFSFILNEYKTDGLTGLRNRKSMDIQILTLEKTNQEYSVILVDIDNFKNINDTYTHAYGDKVLKEISKHVLKFDTRNIRAYRYGGDEIVLIIRKLDLQKVIHVAESLRTEIATAKWNEDVRITASIGIGTGKKDVIAMADKNMYNSKSKGKNFTTYEIDGSKYLAERRIDIRSSDLDEIEAALKK